MFRIDYNSILERDSDFAFNCHMAKIGNLVVQKPIRLGYESSGIVEKCGPEVTRLKIGDRVALEPGAACHTCRFCQHGKCNLSKSMKFAGTLPYDSTLSAFYCIPEDVCYILPKSISLEAGTLVEPLSIAVHCAKLANFSATSSVGVFGAGPIRLLYCAVARGFNMSIVTAIDINELRLAFPSNMLQLIFVIYNKAPQFQTQHTSFQVLNSVKDRASIIIEATGAEGYINCGILLMKRSRVFVQAGFGLQTIAFPI
jgi:L-iditol 2-dehydrogenase